MFLNIIELLLPVSIIIRKGVFIPFTVVSPIIFVVGIPIFARLGYKATILEDFE
jgi:hypothetical protein